MPLSRNTSAGRKRCIWSKNGRSRNIARRNSFSPQPVSGHPLLQIADLSRSRIAAAVIDIDDLVIEEIIERGSDFGDERRDIAGLVLDRDDDRNFHAAFTLSPGPPPGRFPPSEPPKQT